jgi:hypothetical protein
MRNFISNNEPTLIIFAVIVAFCALVLTAAPLVTLAHLLAI